MRGNTPDGLPCDISTPPTHLPKSISLFLAASLCISYEEVKYCWEDLAQDAWALAKEDAQAKCYLEDFLVHGTDLRISEFSGRIGVPHN